MIGRIEGMVSEIETDPVSIGKNLEKICFCIPSCGSFQCKDASRARKWGEIVVSDWSLNGM